MANVQLSDFNRHYTNEFFQDIQEAAKFTKERYDSWNGSSPQITVVCTFSNETKITYVFKKIAEDMRTIEPGRITMIPGIKGHLKIEVKKAVDQRVSNYIVIHFANNGLPIDGARTIGGIKKDPNLVVPNVKLTLECEAVQRNPLFGDEYFPEPDRQVVPKSIQTTNLPQPSVAAVEKFPVSTIRQIQPIPVVKVPTAVAKAPVLVQQNASASAQPTSQNVINVNSAKVVVQSAVSITIGQSTSTAQPVRGSVINMDHAKEINQHGTRLTFNTDGSYTKEERVNEAYEAIQNEDLL